MSVWRCLLVVIIMSSVNTASHVAALVHGFYFILLRQINCRLWRHSMVSLRGLGRTVSVAPSSCPLSTFVLSFCEWKWRHYGQYKNWQAYRNVCEIFVFSSSGLGASRHWLFNGVHVHITYAATLQHILYGVYFTVNVEVGLQCGRLALTDWMCVCML